MNEAEFEDLELHVLTLAFQINGLKQKKSSLTREQRTSLEILEEDYQYYKSRYDQKVKKVEKTVPNEAGFGDW
ncbi:hypothetical protein JZO81_05380 [Enterococcus hulanensis]|nr:hypothetical protein [Enterococcus hulanensis]